MQARRCSPRPTAGRLSVTPRRCQPATRVLRTTSCAASRDTVAPLPGLTAIDRPEGVRQPRVSQVSSRILFSHVVFADIEISIDGAASRFACRIKRDGPRFGAIGCRPVAEFSLVVYYRLEGCAQTATSLSVTHPEVSGKTFIRVGLFLCLRKSRVQPAALTCSMRATT